MLPPPPVSFYLAFSPVPRFDTSKPGGHFLLPYCKLSPAFLLRSMVPCVARTFLSLTRRQGSDRAFCAAKMLKILASYKFRIAFLPQHETINSLCVFQNHHRSSIAILFKAGILKIVLFVFGAEFLSKFKF